MSEKIHITFIHGIANKPAADSLLKSWKDALSSDFGTIDNSIDLDTLGISSSMIYWADVLYGAPQIEIIVKKIEQLESNREEEVAEIVGPDESWRNNLSAEELAFVEGISTKTLADVSDLNPEHNLPIDKRLERFPLPWFVKKPIMAYLLRDVHHYLFNKTFSPRPGVSYQVQTEIRSRVIANLKSVKADKHIVMSHSMGTVIIYDCLKRVADCPEIDALVTIGSPLGLDEIQDKLKPEWTRADGFPEKVVGPWINVYDGLDPVAMFDGNLANDYKKDGQKVIEVIQESNHGAWRHDISKYLSMPKLREALAKLID